MLEFSSSQERSAANAARGQRHARVGRAVVKMNRVPVGPDGLAAWENHTADISGAFIGRFGAEDPGVAPLQAYLRLLEIEERDPETINASGRGLRALRDRAQAIPLRFRSVEKSPILLASHHPPRRASSIILWPPQWRRSGEYEIHICAPRVVTGPMNHRPVAPRFSAATRRHLCLPAA